MAKDKAEEFIENAVARVGWSVNLISAGEREDEPAFAYTTGLYKRFGHAELICFGLRHEVMHGVLNICGDRVKRGEKLPLEIPVLGVLEGFPVRFREVRDLASYREHVGYSIWFNQGPAFPLLQVVWPDERGRFPGEPGAATFMMMRQPLLP